MPCARMGGVLEVALDTVDVGGGAVSKRSNLKAGQYACLTVSDTGHGMEPTTMERVFEPFFTTKDAGEGTGLGMSVVHGIVTKHGGDITGASAPGEGTTFEVYLPMADEPVRPDVVPDEMTVSGNERVLVVEDERQLALVFRKILERFGYHVTVASDGVEALATFRATPDEFDLVITDLTMPRMSGLELAREILHAQPNLPMILTTGVRDGLKGQELKDLGFADILLKPFNIIDLGEAVRRALDDSPGLKK